MIIRVEKLIILNGQEVRKSAEADIPEDHPKIDEIASGLMRSISPPKPREFWLCPATDTIAFDFKAYDSKQVGCENIHVREVLPDEEGKA